MDFSFSPSPRALDKKYFIPRTNSEMKLGELEFGAPMHRSLELEEDMCDFPGQKDVTYRGKMMGERRFTCPIIEFDNENSDWHFCAKYGTYEQCIRMLQCLQNSKAILSVDNLEDFLTLFSTYYIGTKDCKEIFICANNRALYEELLDSILLPHEPQKVILDEFDADEAPEVVEAYLEDINNGSVGIFVCNIADDDVKALMDKKHPGGLLHSCKIWNDIQRKFGTRAFLVLRCDGNLEKVKKQFRHELPASCLPIQSSGHIVVWSPTQNDDDDVMPTSRPLERQQTF